MVLRNISQSIILMVFKMWRIIGYMVHQEEKNNGEMLIYLVCLMPAHIVCQPIEVCHMLSSVDLWRPTKRPAYGISRDKLQPIRCRSS